MECFQCTPDSVCATTPRLKDWYKTVQPPVHKVQSMPSNLNPAGGKGYLAGMVAVNTTLAGAGAALTALTLPRLPLSTFCPPPHLLMCHGPKGVRP